MTDRTTWKTSLRSTFRLVPQPRTQEEVQQRQILRTFLESEGEGEATVLPKLPYSKDRGNGADAADDKRYRDPRQVFRSVGLLYERDRKLHVTPLGKATYWWLDHLTEQNVPVLARFAAFSLAAWQLRNPLRDGKEYASHVNVFPYAFIWRVMLAADGRVDSTELKCEVLRLTDQSEIEGAVARILRYRSTGDATAMQAPIGVDSDDRLIPWMSLASFGWALIGDKKDSTDGYYRIRPDSLSVLERAAEVRHVHRDFATEQAYLEYIERAAAIPEDLR